MTLQTLEEEGDVYARLARSIAPEIWGHEDVKKVGAALSSRQTLLPNSQHIVIFAGHCIQ